MDLINNDLAGIREAVDRLGIRQYGSREWLPQVERTASPPEALARRWIHRETSTTATNVARLGQENARLERDNENLQHRIGVLEERIGNIPELNQEIKNLKTALRVQVNETARLEHANHHLSQEHDDLTEKNEALRLQVVSASQIRQNNIQLEEEKRKNATATEKDYPCYSTERRLDQRE
jgi:DNA repair exonuclease SbcCD ATPase subunit